MNIFNTAIRLAAWAFLLMLVFGSEKALHAADAPAPASNQRDLDFVFAGMRQEWSRFHSGVCRIKGIKTERDASGKEVQYDKTIFVAFDGPNKLRFDRTEMGWVADPSTARPNPADPGTVISSSVRALVTRHYYTDGEKCCFWHEGSPYIELSKAGSCDPHRIDYFDVRALGLYSTTSFSRGYDFNKMVEIFQPAKILKSG
jgi:hypothetical protein